MSKSYVGMCLLKWPSRNLWHKAERLKQKESYGHKRNGTYQLGFHIIYYNWSIINFICNCIANHISFNIRFFISQIYPYLCIQPQMYSEMCNSLEKKVLSVNVQFVNISLHRQTYMWKVHQWHNSIDIYYVICALISNIWSTGILLNIIYSSSNICLS